MKADGPGAAEKLIILLHEMGRAERAVGVSELARAVALPKSTVHRLLATLERAGAVRRLGPRYALQADSVWERAGRHQRVLLVRTVSPYLLELYDLTGLAASYAVPAQGGVLFPASVYPHAFTRSVMRTATLVPPHCTASGKVLLAHDPDLRDRFLARPALAPMTRFTLTDPRRLDGELLAVRRDGVAHDRQEHLLGIWTTAVPVLDGRGRVLGALSLAASGRAPGAAGERALRGVARAMAPAVAEVLHRAETRSA
ncbi:hypothetical protein Afil01_26360 [Actinorhabdospora filicis]|uniref:IclR family transcriptional regulator n=1 Tax=Actinorhabdospora filicis TaxID=1785913 RepID=A0A9W6SLC1_9ACTN|nr:IclR family transcriptional regulator [Actinorhabdospora filicis]GLZ77829.1 hypothetical protein Afil01_26360 [Actinorhabdospora filicis]